EVGLDHPPLWTPSPDRVARANLTAFIATVRREYGADVADYPSLYRWSITSPERFWPAVWRFCCVIAAERDGGAEPWDEVGVGLDRMAPPDPVRGPSWFPGARLNFAENLRRRRDAHPALVSWNESGTRRELSYRALHAATARVAAALRAAGLRPGDRVAGFMPNIPETVIAMLAATSLGAVWSSCWPDFGVAGAGDLFGQIAPGRLVRAGAGGTLLQHQKEHVLHVDLKQEDRLCYITTCGWMMWNWLVSALAVHATVVLYDGAPFAPRPDALWSLLGEEHVSVFGTSAKYL